MLGGDEEYPDLWLIYIDVRIEDKEGNLLGVCGVSMELEEIQKQIAKYEKQYGTIFYLQMRRETFR